MPFFTHCALGKLEMKADELRQAIKGANKGTEDYIIITVLSEPL